MGKIQTSRKIFKHNLSGGLIMIATHWKIEAAPFERKLRIEWALAKRFACLNAPAFTFHEKLVDGWENCAKIRCRSMQLTIIFEVKEFVQSFDFNQSQHLDSCRTDE